MRINCLLVLYLILSTCLFSQPKDTLKTEISAHDTITLEIITIEPDSFPLISITFKAENQKNIPLWNLDSTDIAITEDKDTVHIARFEMLSKLLPVNIALVVDHSGSMALEDGLDNAQYGIIRLIRNLNTEKDSIIIIGFSDEVGHVTPLTNDTTSLMKELWRMKPSGLTSFYDAIGAALDSLNDHIGLRAVIALTDGNDNSSELNRRQVIEKAHKANIPIYIVGLGLSEKTANLAFFFWGIVLDFVDPLELKSFANDLNGEFHYTKSSQKLTEIYEEINRKIHAIYELQYLSSNFASSDTTRHLAISFINGFTEYDAESLRVILPDDVVERMKKSEDRRRLFYGGGIATIAITSGVFLLILVKRKKKRG